MQTSQYLCSACGSLLKETAEYIPIHLLREECPSCGSMLAETLERRAVRPAVRIPPPEIQRAGGLPKLRFDIPRIDSFMGGIGTKDLCCVTGYNANMILTRLCVRSLLPERHGGLGSPYVMVADLGNRSDVYGAISFARQYGMDREKVADRILVVRAFTVPQARRLLSAELPKVVLKYGVRSVFVPGLLNAIDEEPNMRANEAKKEIGRMMNALEEMSRRVLVVASVQKGRYSELVLPQFKKRIALGEADYGRLTAELYSQGCTKTVSLTERELKIALKDFNNSRT